MSLCQQLIFQKQIQLFLQLFGVMKFVFPAIVNSGASYMKTDFFPASVLGVAMKKPFFSYLVWWNFSWQLLLIQGCRIWKKKNSLKVCYNLSSTSFQHFSCLYKKKRVIDTKYFFDYIVNMLCWWWFKVLYIWLDIYKNKNGWILIVLLSLCHSAIFSIYRLFLQNLKLP